MTPLLVVVSGAPCTGKTTLGKQIAQAHNLPYISKDGIKETLFDSLGWQDRGWSQKLGAAAYDLMRYFLQVEMQAGRSCMCEANFRPAWGTKMIQELLDTHGYRVAQLYCQTKEETLMARFRARWESGERHPGHVDDETYDHIQELVRHEVNGPLALGAPRLTVDTTDWSRVDTRAVLAWIAAQL